MNAFFPFAVVTASVCLWLLIDFANQPMTTPAQVVGAVLVGTMLALAIVEHFHAGSAARHHGLVALGHSQTSQHRNACKL